MRKSDYKCIKKCNSKEYRIIKESAPSEKNSLDFLELARKADFFCCPFCGALYPATVKRFII